MPITHTAAAVLHTLIYFFCFAQRKLFIENVTYCTDLISRWSQLHTAACIHLSRPQSFFCFGQRTIFIDNITHCFRDQSDLIWRPSVANYNEHSRAFLGLQIFWRRWGGNLNPISLSDFFSLSAFIGIHGFNNFQIILAAQWAVLMILIGLSVLMMTLWKRLLWQTWSTRPHSPAVKTRFFYRREFVDEYRGGWR